MSYTILYRRLFVKLPSQRYIFFIEAGDNNVYDRNYLTGRERRERSWEAWNVGPQRQPSYSEEDLLAWLEEEKNRAMAAAADSDGRFNWKKNFGWYRCVALAGSQTTNTSWGAFKNFFIKGMQNAITLEDFVRFTYSKPHLFYYRSEEGNGGGTFVTGPEFTTEEDLMRAWNEVHSLVSSNQHSSGPWIKPAYSHTICKLADVINCESTAKGLVVEAKFEGEATRYISSIYPLQFTSDKDLAFHFPRKIQEELFSTVSAMKKGLCRMSYQYIR